MKSTVYSLLLASPVLALPESYEISTWAEPFEIEYPAAITASADGTVYVSCDRNGSLGKDKDVGKIVACSDTDGDGKADRFIDFVPKIDSPRGGHFVRDTLYLIHPPFLSSFRDTTGDGVADEHKVLLENLGVGLSHPRGSDHTTNGCRMGIDGWLYIAVGDFGMEATKGTDGRVVTLHGGGVARVRPDGSELEVFSYHTRNICDVAISPQLDLFSRDNTNDGKGWNIRVHHHTNGVDHGYPRLYKNFTDEGVTPLFDGGGGSGTGALYLAEPGHEEMLLTCDWTTGKIYHDKLTPNGASFKLKESVFLDLERAVDIDVDGESNLYVCDWRGGRFRYAGEGVKVGLIQKLTKKGLKVEKFPNLVKMSNADLVKQFESPSAVRRLETQREILARGGDELWGLLLEAGTSMKARNSVTAAVFTLAQLDQEKWKMGLVDQVSRDIPVNDFKELMVRSIADRDVAGLEVLVGHFTEFLVIDTKPVQLQTLVALMRMGAKAKGSSTAILKLARSTKDERLHHTAIQALVAISEVEVLLGATDQAAALLALQRLHDPVVASALIVQLMSADEKLPLIGVLARLYHQEGMWDLKAWWGTRPDDRGPYFTPTVWSETESIKSALERAFATLDMEGKRQAMALFGKNRLPISSMDLGDQDPVGLALISTSPSESEAALLVDAAIDKKRDWSLRIKCFRTLARVPNGGSIRPQLKVLGSWLKRGEYPDDVEREVLDFTNQSDLINFRRPLREVAAKSDVQTSRVAWRALLTQAQSPLAKDRHRDAIQKILAKNPREEGLFLALADLLLPGFESQIKNAIESDNDTLIMAAKRARKLIQEAGASSGKRVAELKLDDVMKLVMEGQGNAEKGKNLYMQQGCIACHAVDQAAVQKGPYLGSAGSKFTRDYLIQSILDPNAVVAQGFQTELVTLNDGTAHMGFVTREEDGIVDLRDIAGAVKQLKESDIKKRDHQATSMMPPGLALGLTVEQFVDLIDYLGSLKEGGK